MDESIHPLLKGWDTFYVIIGAGAAALTGLMFVAITLIAEGQMQASNRQIRAFGTPTIVHFVATLILSGLLTAPWPRIEYLAWTLKLSGGAATLYAAAVIVFAKRQQDYKPVLSDLIWFEGMPVVAYGALTLAAFFLIPSTELALFGVAGVVMLLLVIAIHNVWDTVTYVAITRRNSRS